MNTGRGTSGREKRSVCLWRSARLQALAGGALLVMAQPLYAESAPPHATLGASSGVHDTFTGGDGTMLTARTADVEPGGASWTVWGDAPSPVLEDGALRAAGGTSYVVATIDSGLSDGVAATDFRARGTPEVQYAGLVFRAVDANQLLLLRYASTPTAGILQLFQRVAGDFLLVTGTMTLPAGVPGALHRLEARFVGNAIEAVLDNVVIFTATVSLYRTATRHGVLWHIPSDATATFDNFTVSPATHVRDTFSGSNGTLLTAHPVDVAPGGASWTVWGGPPAPVLQDGALRTAGGTDYVVATIDSGLADGVVAADFRAQGLGEAQYAGVVFRAIDINQLLLLRYASTPTTGMLQLFQRVAGDFLLVAGTMTLPAGAPGALHRLEARFVGNAIEAVLDHVVIFTATVNLYRTATRQGVLWHIPSDAGATFDNFTVAPAADTTNPAVTITAPTSSATVVVNSAAFTLGGTASDNVGVTHVTWSNDRGGSGMATETTSWSASPTLHPGVNVLTVSASDAANNTASDTLTVLVDTTMPVVAIATPTPGATFDTGEPTIVLGGTAADALGVTQVTWSNNRGGLGTASGTTNWSANVPLQSGSNLLTVTARDGANNTATDTLTITFTHTPARVFDSFTRDGEWLTSHRLDVGPPGLRWTPLAGSSPKLLQDGTVVLGGGSSQVTTIDIGVSDVMLTVESVGRHQGGLVLRATDANNYLLVGFNDHWELALFRRADGRIEQLAATAVEAEDWVSYPLVVRATGDLVHVGASGAQFTVSVPFQQTATRHGLRWTGSTDVVFDNFELTSPQPLPASWASGCATAVSPPDIPAAARDGDSGSVTVTAPPACSWGADSPDGLVKITGGSPGLGNGTVTWQVGPNSHVATRNTTFTVAGRTITLSQQAQPCTVTLTPPSTPDHAHYRDPTGGFINVANDGCAWAVTGVPSWMTLVAGASGTGPGTIRYELTFNGSGVTRVANLTIASQVYRVTQRGDSSTGSGTGTGSGGTGGSGGGDSGGQTGTGSCAAIALPGIECWDTFAADVIIRRTVTGGDGAWIGQLTQPIQYRWERSLVGSQWHTTLTILSAPDGPIASALGATHADVTGTRIEDDGTSSGLRVYGSNGAALALPADSLRAALGLSPFASLGVPTPDVPLPASRPAEDHVPRWVENYVFTPANRDARFTTFAQRFGGPSGSVRGLSQYVALLGESVQELLIDPATAVIKEANVTRNGGLVLHTTRSYAGGSGGSLVLQAIHTEHLVSPDSGERAVTDIEFTNIRFERRR